MRQRIFKFSSETSRLKIGNRKGSLFIMSYLVILVLVALGAAYVVMSFNEGLFAERQKRTIQAFHIAEAGVERGLYDLRQDFVAGGSTPSWSDGDINGMSIGPNTSSYFSPTYSSTTLNGGSYLVEFMNVGSDGIWVRSTGTLGDVTQTILVYARMDSLSVWDNAIFAGSGASGQMVNGNVDIRGSVHILGTNLTSADYAIDLGGTAELVGNNYNGLDSSLAGKVPALDTVVFNGETVSTLNAELRVKNGIVGLSGSATVGEADISANSVKETVDGTYVTHGFGGSQSTSNVYSDNGWSNAYDLGNSVSFPSLGDPAPANPSITYQQYLRTQAYVPTAAEETTLASLTPGSNFTIGDAKGTITMDGAGNMTIDGIVYIDNGSDFAINKSGSNKTITYTGTGSLLVTGDIAVNVDLITSGSSSYPNNIIGFMTPNNISMDEAGIDVMALVYAENTVTVAKQTDIMGTIVSNYFDMGTNVPAIYQVPEVANNLPPGMIGGEPAWAMKVISWQKL